MRSFFIKIIISLAFILAYQVSSLAANHVVVTGLLPSEERSGFQSIKSGQDGGVILVSENTVTRQYALYKIDSSGAVIAAIVLPSVALDTNQLLRNIEVETVQLLNGDIIVISHNGPDNQRGITRMARFNSQLEFIGSSTYYAGDLFRKMDNILPADNGGFVIMYYSSFSRISRLVNFSADGTIIWQRNNTLPLAVTAVQRIRLLALTNNNGASYYSFVPSFIVLKITQPLNYTFISYRYGSSGNLLQTVDKALLTFAFNVNDFPSIIGINQESAGFRYTFSFSSPSTPFVRIYQELFNTGGQLIDTGDYELDILYVPGSIRSAVSNHDEVLSRGDKHLFIRRWNGSQYTEIIPLLDSSISKINYRFTTPRVGGGWWVSGLLDYGDGRVVDIWVGLPSLAHNIEGAVFKDFDKSCSLGGDDQPYVTPWVGFKNVIGYFTLPDESGRYSLRLPKATYQADVLQPGRLWELCDDQRTLLVDADKIHDLPMQPKADCADLSVDVTAPFLVRCRENEYTLTYKNFGPGHANEAFIQVDVDTLLSITESEVPFIPEGKGRYRVELGSIPADVTGIIRFKALLDCNLAVPGQTHCVEARIFPDSLCTPEPLCWDGSQIKIEANCEGDTAVFRIYNIGRNPISNPRPLLVLEDDIMRRPPIPVQLPSGGMQEITYQAAGKTIRVQVPQGDCFPFPSFPASILEGCGGVLSTGFVTTLFQDDAVITKSIWCLESLEQEPDAFLYADPKGYDVQRFISDSTELEYTFFFNTSLPGSGELYLIDSLSQYLDISTLRVGTSTFPYDITLFNNGVLRVAFDISDSTRTNGYFKFKVFPLKRIAPGTKIFNKGSLFRFGAPTTATNETFHTIGSNFINVIITSIEETWRGSVEVKAFPNPFSGQFRLLINNVTGQKAFIQIMDLQGRVMRYQQLTGDDVITTDAWPSGIYLFNIISGDGIVATGKLIRK
jgi:hypothetical protein